MSNKRKLKLMPVLNERLSPPWEPDGRDKLMTAFMASGELPAEEDPTFWDRVTARLEEAPTEIAGQEKAGRSWLTSTTSPDK